MDDAKKGACRTGAAFAAGGFALMVSSLPAMAQTIDGEWCRDGDSFRINGQDIQTVVGSKATGENERYAFRYTAPENEPDAGAEIIMALRSEEMLYLLKKPKGAAGYQPREVWRRCKVTS